MQDEQQRVQPLFGGLAMRGMNELVFRHEQARQNRQSYVKGQVGLGRR